MLRSHPCARLVLLMLALAPAAAALGAELPLRIAGASLGREARLLEAPLAVRGAAGPSTTPVLVIEQPVVEGAMLRLEGRVRTRDLQGEGYLELWVELPGGERYFSRTLADAGPLARLRGSEGPRPFLLPFQLGAGSPAPVRLEMNVVLPGAGQVLLDELRYMGHGPPPGSAPTREAWWSEPTAARVGAFGGTGLGLLGAAIGLLGGLGRGRTLAAVLLRGMQLAGGGVLLAGLAALGLRQPFWVSYPLLLLGGLGAGLGLLLLPVLRRRTAPPAHPRPYSCEP